MFQVASTSKRITTKLASEIGLDSPVGDDGVAHAATSNGSDEKREPLVKEPLQLPEFMQETSEPMVSGPDDLMTKQKALRDQKKEDLGLTNIYVYCWFLNHKLFVLILKTKI